MASANTDEVFEADANAEIRADARARSHSRHPYPADKDRKPAIGAVDHSVYEETPLLEREANHSRDSNDGPPEDGSERDAPEWFGARDFEGKPWWKKPSVSDKSLTLEGQLAANSIDLLASATIPDGHTCIGRCHCPQSRPHTRPHLP